MSGNVCAVCDGGVKLLFTFCVFSENLFNVRYTAFLHGSLFRLNYLGELNYLEHCSILVTKTITLLGHLGKLNVSI